MIKKKIIREINGKKLIKRFENQYGSIESLKSAFKRDPENVKLHMDLEDWEYFKTNLDEKIKETEIIYSDK